MIIKFKTGLREIAKIHTGEFRLTANQNVIIANVSSQKKKKINELIEQYGLTDGSIILHFAAVQWHVYLFQHVDWRWQKQNVICLL